MATARNQSLSINMVMNSAIKGANFLQVSVNKLHKTAVRLETINLFKSTKFSVLNRNLKSLDKTLQKTQSRVAKISRTPLEMMGINNANQALKTNLRTHKAIERSQKQTAFYSQKHTQNILKQNMYQKTKSRLKGRAKVVGAVAVGSAIGAVTSLNPIRKAIDFETSIADVTKATDATEAQTKKLKQNILNQVKKGSLLTASQIAQIQAGGGRSGVAIKDLSMFTTDIAKASVAMDLSTEESGRQFAKMAERMNLPISKIKIMTNAFTHLENNGANSAKDLINTTGRLAGIFKELKFSPENSAGLSNYMNTLEVSPELAATSFKILNNRFKKTNSKYHYFSRLQKKGAGELKNIIIDINKTMTKQQIMKTFGSQGANVISKMSGDLKNLDKSLKLVSGNKFMSAVDNEYRVKMNTTGAKETMAKNRIEGGTIVLGDKMKHQYVSFLNLLSNGITKITEFYNANEKLIKSIGGIGLKVVGVAVALKGISWVASPFIGILKGLWKIKGVLSALRLSSKLPIKQGIEITKSKMLLGKFKSVLSTLFSFAKRNPIIIGATLATGVVMAGLNHMAENAKSLKERQKQKGIGKSLQVNPVNNSFYNPTKAPLHKKGMNPKDTMASRLKALSLAPEAVLPTPVPTAIVESPSAATSSHLANMGTVQSTGGNVTYQTIQNTFHIAKDMDEADIDRMIIRSQRRIQHQDDDVNLKDVV